MNDDVLLHILDFMSLEDIHKINRTCRLIHEISMKYRYAKLEITNRDKATKELLTRLCEWDVGRHVKKVKIRPWFLPLSTNSPQSFTEKLIVWCMEFAVDPHYTKDKAKARLQERLRSDKTRITTALKSMNSLREFELDWDETCDFHPELFRAFLAPPLESWQGHLTSLTVKVPPSLAYTLSDVRLPNLETFVFHYTTGDLTEQEAIDAHDGFLVFVNNLKDSLRSLTFTSTYTSRNLNLSHMFDRMGVFPFLRKISLSIPFEGGHLPEPSSFVKFLVKHQNLNHINLFTTRCVIRWTPGHPDGVNWIQKILSSIPHPLPQLRGLGVALRPLRAPLTILAEFLCTHSSIETLLLEDRALQTTQINDLFPHFSRQPIFGILHFQTKVEALTPDLIAYFAFKFPNLRTLKVECSQILLFAPGFHSYRTQTQSLLDLFDDLSPPLQHDIEEWGLRSFFINPSAADHRLEAWFVAHIPQAKVGYFTPGI